MKIHMVGYTKDDKEFATIALNELGEMGMVGAMDADALKGLEDDGGIHLIVVVGKGAVVEHPFMRGTVVRVDDIAGDGAMMLSKFAVHARLEKA
jgi:hypothetical protein